MFARPEFDFNKFELLEKSTAKLYLSWRGRGLFLKLLTLNVNMKCTLSIKFYCLCTLLCGPAFGLCVGGAYVWQRGQQRHMCGWISGEFHVGWLCNRRPNGAQRNKCMSGCKSLGCALICAAFALVPLTGRFCSYIVLAVVSTVKGWQREE